MRLLVGILAFSSYELQALAPLCRCLLYTNQWGPFNFIDIKVKIRTLYWKAQLQLVRQAVRAKCDHLLFLDDDIVLAEGTILQLLNRNLPAVSACYLDRFRLGRPILTYETPEGDYVHRDAAPGSVLVEVDCTGFGCMLLKREVFEQLKPADFEWFDRTPPGHWAISKAIRKMGYKIHVDLRTSVGHILEIKEVRYPDDTI